MNNSQLERLGILSEECGEVVQALGKVFRHGLEGKWKNEPSNRENLEAEIGDVLHAIDILISNGDISKENINIRRNIKKNKIKKYIHYKENKI